MIGSKQSDVSRDDILKEGWLKKESRYRKKWRDRWCVLTSKYFYTFENEKIYKNPTEKIEVAKIKTVKTDEIRNGNFFVSHFL